VVTATEPASWDGREMLGRLRHAIDEVLPRFGPHEDAVLSTSWHLAHELVEWMWSGLVDGAEWVMLPNVIGMALHADGGRMATKPYAGGGACIDRMSDDCRDCEYDRRKRIGEDARPFTTLYWGFLARHEDRFARNPRVARQVRAARRLTDLDDVRGRAAEVLVRLDRGEL